MGIRNTDNSYGSVAKWFHWVSAALIIGMLFYGTIFTTIIPDGPVKNLQIYIHKSFGLLIIALILIRWIWHAMNPKPKILGVENELLKKATHWFHECLYIAIFIMLLSGVLLTATKHYELPFFWLFSIKTTWMPQSHTWHEFFGDIHQIFAWVITGMLVLHVVAAIKHHVSNKDDTLRRMWIQKK